MTEQLYKVLGSDRRSLNGGSGTWTPGVWRSVSLPLVPCEHGLHLCTLAQLPGWLGPTIWEAEVGGARIDQSDKIVVERARITRRVEGWNERTARLFAADCAEHMLPLFERECPDDDRPRRTIAMARAYANGEATSEQLAAAGDAAGAAARDAERDWQVERLRQYLRGEIA